MSEDTSRAGRFLDAFNKVEAALRAADGSDRNGENRKAFGALVRHSKALAKLQKDRLWDVGDLRNAIVHEPGGWGGNPIADPREEIVEWLEGQVEVIENPPRVRNVLKLRPPEVLAFDADLGEFLQLVADQDFSQAPIRREDSSLGLITTNAVARWVATEYRPADGIAAEHATVGQVEKNREEDVDQLELRPGELKAVEAARLFAGTYKSPGPAAIVLTQNGKPRETPIGICTRSDVAQLLTALGV